MTEPTEFAPHQPTPEVLTLLTEADLQSLTEIMPAAFNTMTAEDLAIFVPMAIESDSADVIISRGQEGKIVSAMVLNIDFCLGKLRGRIDDVATHEDHRRQGHSGTALDYALRWFSERGVRLVELTTLNNREAAQRIYESRGFTRYDINNFHLNLH